ncbi:non-ribosomal peptide synthetase [Actinoplanes teichomyceticus]|uniref:non-ribosomal peptide synthetase n=1 Tax=Actinoplanes teichomyceticus TaxID=1867 RepID=UPI001EF2DBBB|nr:non-ribosomal peptide synthetase [Actinoplanes teichomyceticus]
MVRELLARALEREPATIRPDEPFLTLGLDSLTAIDLVKELETRLGRTLSTTLFFEHRTIGELAAHLSGAADPAGPAAHDIAPTGGRAEQAARDIEPAGRAARDIEPAGRAARGADPAGGPQPPPQPPQPADPAGEFPLSPVQRAFHTNGRLHPRVPSYAYVRQTLAGSIDTDRLAAAFAEVERRHPMLRARFGGGGQRIQRPGGDRPAWLTVTRLTRPVAEVDAELRNRTFDLEREAPIRAVLAVEDAGPAHLILVAHHAAVDGYSLAILGDELWARYAGAGLPPAPERTLADHQALRGGPHAEDLAWWRATLAGYPGLALPFDGDPRQDPEPPYAVHQVALDARLSRRLAEHARDAGVSLFHLLLAGYVRCLARWSGQDDVPVQVARAGRTARLAGIDRMVGPFADTLPVLARAVPGESIVALAERLREAWLESERHGSVSTADLARMLAVDLAGPRTASPASFSFARFPRHRGTAAHVLATTAGTASAATRLGLVCFDFHDALHFSWNYPAALFEAGTVRRFAADHLAEITAVAAADRTAAPAGRVPPVAERIRRQCRRTPDRIAVLADGEPFTYRQLDEASDRLAARLAGHRARRIGLLTAPGTATVVGVVGILKANAAWVPLDAAHPPARLAGQLSRAQVDVVVGEPATEALLDGFTLVDVWDGTGGEPPAVTTRPGDDAYVIFTSGSTGRPKGVPVSHRSMTTYLDWALATFGYHAGDRLAQTASICFDASVRQLLAPLLVGATVVTWDRDTVRDPQRLAQRLAADRVTVWSSVPTLWERLLAAAERDRPDLSALRWVHVGGEELSPAHVRRWFDLLGPGQRIANLYGPTETTINATFHVISERPADDVRHLPIGRPVGGAITEVIGPDGRRCGPGEDGELWIGGTGVAAGYLDDPELTAAAFVERDGRRWYRSGDRAVCDADGVLWFRGRLDDQVKLHGYRVEPGEVEAVLRGHPQVARVAVRVDGSRLVAWVQPEAGAAVDAAGLRAYLDGILPFYLVPARIEMVAELALTATGKIDRARLTSSPRRAPVDPPRTPTERLLAGVWERQLGVPAVGRDDDFFALGGDSIGVLEMFAALEADRPVLPRPTVIYRRRTLAALAAEIDAAPAPTRPVVRADAAEFPLTPSQRGFLLADAVGAGSAWLAAPRVHGPLDAQRFQQAVNVLVERHPMLRTVFRRHARPPVQRELAPGAALTVEYVTEPGPIAAELAAERAHRFDPARWPLVRLRLLRVGPREHVLLLHAHHLVGDGYSVALLARELLAVYDHETLPPLRSSFRDYVALLERAEPEIAPYDGAPLGRGARTATAGVTLGPAVVAALRSLAAAAGTTPMTPVLTAFHRALGRVLHRADPTIGVAVTGRDHSLPDLARLFGPCATAVAVRPGPSAGRTPAEPGPAVHAVPPGRTVAGPVEPGPAAPAVRPGPDDGFGADLERMADAVIAARGRSFVAPHGWQFFFTYLDFAALGPQEGRTLRLAWDGTDAEMAVPPGTDVLLAARPAGSGLRLTFRGRLSEPVLTALAAQARADLEAFAAGRAAPSDAAPGNAAAPGARRGSAGAAKRRSADAPLDAALIGYLPAPAHLAALAGDLPESVRRMLPTLSREAIRTAVFPDGAPRLLETVDTRLGRSGFLCLPRFADELTAPGLAADAAAAADLAAGSGARTVSLAGMIPAHTGYGAAVAELVRSPVRVTTGHAVTAASVARTTFAAAGRCLAGRVLAVLGVGSIGSSSLALLLARAETAPAGLLLCDLPSATERLSALAADLRERGYPGPIEIVTDGPGAVYRAEVIVAATSGGPGTLDVGRLRPGTILVDDSFPHCFDTTRALARMRAHADVLIVGGGLLDCGPATRTAAAGLPVAAHPGRLPGTVASCQLESLLHAVTPGLPLVCGPVSAAQAASYWEALDAAGVGAAPLHLLGEVVGRV